MLKIVGLFLSALFMTMVAVRNLVNGEPAREVYESLIIAAAFGGVGALLAWRERE